MRRGTNIRKRKRLLMQELNHKSFYFLLVLCLVLIICVVIYAFFLQNNLRKKHLEKDSSLFSSLNETIPFSIRKIVLYSSATATTDTLNQFVSLHVSQYCDIGIYLNNLDQENTHMEALYIDSITFSAPELGTPCLYKKRIHDLGKCTFAEENKIQDSFAFSLIDDATSLNEDNYELAKDGSTPISLGFYNQDIKKDMIVNQKEIHYNGTLLKTAVIPKSSLQCTVSFTLHIITTTQEHYICNISFPIPFEDKDGSLYENGYVNRTIQADEVSKFIRIS